jgi:cystathionine beta-lyase
MPLDALAEAGAQDAGLLLLCNPYNPVGRCLKRPELERIVEICRQNDIVICSDEIHCDLIFDGRRHVPTASLSPEAADIAVTLMAPSKTFNLAGFGGSFAIIQNPGLREKFKGERRGIVGNVGIMAYESMVAAYRDCEDWRQALIAYLQGNRDYLYAELNQIDGIRMNYVEGTYLAWLDVSSLGVKDPPAYFESHGIGMSEGYRFGDDRFMRLNFGCARSMLEEAVSRIKTAADAAL